MFNFLKSIFFLNRLKELCCAHIINGSYFSKVVTRLLILRVILGVSIYKGRLYLFHCNILHFQK